MAGASDSGGAAPPPDPCHVGARGKPLAAEERATLGSISGATVAGSILPRDRGAFKLSEREFETQPAIFWVSMLAGATVAGSTLLRDRDAGGNPAPDGRHGRPTRAVSGYPGVNQV